MRRLVPALITVLATMALVASVAMAAPANFTHATGSIGLSGPWQSVSFDAFDYGTSGDRGSVTYTNYEYPAPGSGAWLPVAGAYTLTFSGSYVHTMTIDTVMVVSPTNVLFSGTGIYNPDPSYTWTITGSIVDGLVSFHILYTGGPNVGYYVDGTGAAATMSGTAVDSNTTSLTWVVSPAFAHEVLHYTASITCATVNRDASTASFGYTIPAGFPGLSGLNIVMSVYDGGSPGTNGDTYGHGVGTCGGAVTTYAITSGNLVVH
jgi:hypothetical protein